MAMTSSDGSTTPITFQTDAARAAITNEQLELIGFASRLGTCVNNDTSGSKKAKSVRDEAKLLLSLLMGKKASDILSEEIGVNEEEENDVKAASRPTGTSMEDFSFTFPVLSLQMGSDADAANQGDDASDTAQSEKAEKPPPSVLLARPQCVSDKGSVRHSSEAMARNVLESFGAALVWRATTWVNSLAGVLALRVNPEGADKQEIDDDEEQEESKFDADEIMNSREMQIIDSIVRSSEEVSVVNVKTSFRVLPQRIEVSTEPASKKQKTGSDPNTRQNATYKVAHKLAFEAVVSMTSNEGDKYKKIKLQAPGIIEGTFIVHSADGEDNLRGVSIQLDTDALAMSIERESRAVVRRAAEAALLAASGMQVTGVAHVHHSIISPRYVLMTPIQQHDGSDQETDGQRSLSTFSTSVPSQGEDEGCSVSSAATTPTLTSAKIPRGSSILRSPSPALLESSNP